MDTVTIINKLRGIADIRAAMHDDNHLAELLNEAADRLEELDERVAIMMENEPGGDDSFGY